MEWLKAQRDSGGTELGVAMEQALRLPREPRWQSHHLLLAICSL
ncbi:MAG: hypothetical protein R2867_45915 [Caldilineaceae bacterium]